MKNLLCLLLAVLFCFPLASCGLFPGTMIIEYCGVNAINPKRFGECIVEVTDLTLENWNNYITVLTHSEEYEIKNAFGDLIDTPSVEYKVFGMQTEYFYRYEDVVFELQHIETGEKETFSLGLSKGYISKKAPQGYVGLGHSVMFDDFDFFDLENYQCTRIIGRVYLVSLPQEAILTPDPDFSYECAFRIEGFPYEINPHTRCIYHNTSENWSEKYLNQ